MLEFLDSGKNIVKIPQKVELASRSELANFLFDFSRSKFYALTSTDKNIKTIRYQIYYTYENDTRCVLSQSVKAYSKDGIFYVMEVMFKIIGTYRVVFSAGEKDKIERVVEVVESEAVINKRNEEKKKERAAEKEKRLRKCEREKKKMMMKKKKRSRPPRNRKQKNPRPLRRRTDPPSKRRNLTHLYQGFEAEETALIFSKYEMKRQLVLFCMDKPYS